MNSAILGFISLLIWWDKMDSNHRPQSYQDCALPTVLLPQNKMVGKEGIEPTQPMAPDLQSGVTLQLHRLPT